jgi:hypothetical protein
MTIRTNLLRTHTLRAIHLIAMWDAINGYYVIPGQTPTISERGAGSNMSVDVSAFKYILNAVKGEKLSVTNVAIDASDPSLPRIDVLYLNSSAVLSVSKGAAMAIKPTGESTWQKYEEPYPADFSAITGIVLAEILVRAGTTSIVNVDIRPLVLPALSVIGPATNTDLNIPQWDGANSKTLKNGLGLVTAVGSPGSDSNVPSEKAVRAGLDARILHSLATAANDFLVASGSGAFIKKTLAETKTLLGVVEGAAKFWTAFPGTPARVSDTSFSVTDTGNANLYDKMYSPGTIIKWEKSGGGFQVARIITAAYATNTVTYTLKGNTLAAGFTDMKYCIHKSLKEVFYVPGTMPGNTATVNIGKTWIPDCDILIFDARSRYETAPTTTAGVWDINDDGATIQTTKLSQTAGQNLGVDTQCNSTLATATTVIAKDSIVTIDYDSGHATTPGADAMIEVWWIPEAWRYLS